MHSFENCVALDAYIVNYLGGKASVINLIGVYNSSKKQVVCFVMVIVGL